MSRIKTVFFIFLLSLLMLPCPFAGAEVFIEGDYNSPRVVIRDSEAQNEGQPSDSSSAAGLQLNVEMKGNCPHFTWTRVEGAARYGLLWFFSPHVELDNVMALPMGDHTSATWCIPDGNYDFYVAVKAYDSGSAPMGYSNIVHVDPNGRTLEVGQTFTDTLTDGSGRVLRREIHVVRSFGSDAQRGLLILPEEAWFEGVPVPDFAISDQEVEAFLSALEITPAELGQWLEDFGIGFDDLYLLAEGYTGKGTGLKEILRSVYDLESDDGAAEVFDFYQFLNTAKVTIQGFDEALARAGYTFESFVQKMDDYVVTFGDLLYAYLASGATSLDDFLAPSTDATVMGAPVPSSFKVTNPTLDLYTNGQWPGHGFRILNSADNNFLHCKATVDQTFPFLLVRVTSNKKDYISVKFDVESHYAARYNNTAIPGQYLEWGYFKKNEIKQHGGFGILGCKAQVGDPWNVGTANDPSPGSVVQVSLKTKWWNWVNYTSVNLQFNGNEPVKAVQ